MKQLTSKIYDMKIKNISIPKTDTEIKEYFEKIRSGELKPIELIKKNNLSNPPTKEGNKFILDLYEFRKKETESFEANFKESFKKYIDYKAEAKDKDFEKKIEFLQSYMDKITELLFDAKHNYQLHYSDFEFDFERLFDLKNDIENHINILFNKNSTSTNEKKQIRHFDNRGKYYNEIGFKLFKYLVENYYFKGRKTKAKMINIWHFFNNELNNRSKFEQHISKVDFIELVKSTYKIKISNADKKPEYETEHKPKLNSLLQYFEGNLE